MKGADLVGLRYRHPLSELVPYQKQIRGQWVHAVLPSETVTNESTGIVHIAPGHGPDDFEIGTKHDLEPFSPVDEAGNYTDEVGDHFVGQERQGSERDRHGRPRRRGVHVPPGHDHTQVRSLLEMQETHHLQDHGTVVPQGHRVQGGARSRQRARCTGTPSGPGPAGRRIGSPTPGTGA